MRSAGRPVDQARSAVDESLFVKAHKGFAHRFGESVVQGEALARPITGGAQASDLLGDAAAVFFLPLPGALDEFSRPSSSRFMPSLASIFLHQHLGGNAGMVGAGHPQGRDALHAVVADHQIFHGDEHGMPGVQFTGHVGRGDGDDEGLSCWRQTRVCWGHSPAGNSRSSPTRRTGAVRWS